MTGELRKFDCTIRVQMPGQAKENEYHVFVKADTRIEAEQRLEEEWKQITELKDVRIKEVEKVMTA